MWDNGLVFRLDCATEVRKRSIETLAQNSIMGNSTSELRTCG